MDDNDEKKMARINKLWVKNPAEAREKQEHIVVRLGDELDKLVKMGRWLRECLENELYEGMGYKKLGTNKGTIAMFKDLAMTMDSVVKTKIAFDKAQKILADNMTETEEQTAVIKYLCATTKERRHHIFQKVQEWLDRRSEVTESTVQDEN